ncbi:ketopantoate reductase family protein [Aliikangiella sp. IMCC44632]
MANTCFNIIGAGAMGHLWACYLKRQGLLANLYSRQPQASRRVSLVNKQHRFRVELDYTPIKNWQAAPVTIICVKAHQLESLCNSLPKQAFKDESIILMMNGLGLEEIVQRYFPTARVIQAYTSHGVYQQPHKDSLIVNHSGNGETYLGFQGLVSASSPWQDIVELLNCALPPTQWSQSHKELLLIKLIVNAVINPLTAVNNCTNGEILHNGQLNEQAHALLYELTPIIDVMLPQLTFNEIKSRIEKVALSTANNYSSMQQDIARKNKTEIDFINGYLLKTAQKLGFSLTKHNEIIQQIKLL